MIRSTVLKFQEFVTENYDLLKDRLNEASNESDFLQIAVNIGQENGFDITPMTLKSWLEERGFSLG